MERLVDYDKFIMDYGVLSNHEDDYRLLCAANITAYTKDEVIAMLTEIQLEIEELPTNRMAITDSSGLICYGYSAHEPTAKDASKVIQQKINALKAESEETND